MLLIKQTRIYHDWLNFTGYPNNLQSLHLFLILFEETMTAIERKYRKQ